MNLNTLWQLVAPAKPSVAEKPLALDEPSPLQHTTVLHTAQSIRHFCSMLIGSKVDLFQHGAQGASSTPLRMVGCTNDQVILEWSTLEAPTNLGKGEVLHLVAAAHDGMAIFTLSSLHRTGRYVVRAGWPALVVRNQSREHYRVPVPSPHGPRITLRIQGWGTELRVLDLSESGLYFVSAHRLPPPLQRDSQAVLKLAQEEVPITQLQIVRELQPAPSQWGYGATMRRLQEVDRCMLRRWIQHAQTHYPRHAL